MKLLLVDGYSLLYRAFFSAPPLTTKDGQPTGALYGFTKMVLRLLDENKPDYALVAMDHSAPTFRHVGYAEYKAGRAPAPDDLKSQTSRVRGLMDGLSIPHYEHEGFEADDILGTLSRIGSEAGHEVIIVTGDGDALQLADENTTVLLTRRGVSDLEAYNPEAVRTRFNFLPPLLPDYKGLRGDTSDNIPGVPGIGEKTASNLIGTFGALEQVYEHLEEVTPVRMRELLREHREAAFESRQLARIVRELPLEIDLEACRYANPLSEEQRQRAHKTAREFQFKSLARRYETKSDAVEDDGEGEEEPSQDAPTPLNIAPQIALSDAEVYAWLHQHGMEEARPVAMLLHLKDEAHELFLAQGEDALLYQGELEPLRAWLEDAQSPKIAHDAKPLKLALCAQNIGLRGLIGDTFLMGYLLEPTRQNHPLSLLALKQLNRVVPEVPVEARKKKTTSLFEEEEESEALSGPDAAQLTRAAEAVAMGLLEPVLRAKMRRIGAESLFEELELPLIDVLVSIEQVGMALDAAQLRDMGQTLEAEAKRLEAEIYEAAGEKFTIGSPKQLQVILFEKLGLAKGRANKTGFSTDVHTLERLAEDHAIVRKILNYRGTTKLKTTYVDALLQGMDAQTHRIHCNLNQTGTVSGRLSSSNPNLQNVPIRTAQGRMIRKAFIVPPGHVILKADYSQIELRILAHITGDAPLVEAFRSGEDVHARTAANLFHIDISEVDNEKRRLAKMTNYAIAYGVSGFGLAKQLGTGNAADAQAFINRYFEGLPGVKKYIDDTLQAARAQGYVETLMGRRRPLPEIRTPRHQERAAAERTAINHPIQGTSADAMKLAMLSIHAQLREQNLKARMTMQVHDELVFEVPEDEVERVSQLVESAMRDVPTQRLELRVPLEVELGMGHNWDEAKAAGDVEVVESGADADLDEAAEEAER